MNTKKYRMGNCRSVDHIFISHNWTSISSTGVHYLGLKEWKSDKLSAERRFIYTHVMISIIFSYSFRRDSLQEKISRTRFWHIVSFLFCLNMTEKRLLHSISWALRNDCHLGHSEWRVEEMSTRWKYLFPRDTTGWTMVTWRRRLFTNRRRKKGERIELIEKIAWANLSSSSPSGKGMRDVKKGE